MVWYHHDKEVTNKYDSSNKEENVDHHLVDLEWEHRELFIVKEDQDGNEWPKWNEKGNDMRQEDNDHAAHINPKQNDHIKNKDCNDILLLLYREENHTKHFMWSHQQHSEGLNGLENDKEKKAEDVKIFSSYKYKKESYPMRIWKKWIRIKYR